MLWNHAPRMWGAMASRGVAVPAPSEQQSADLFIYIYSASYFEAPGDPRRGKDLFFLKRCGQCHGVRTAVRERIKPAVEWESPRDPIALAQQMWNHSGEMARALESSRVAYPVFTAQELTDVLAWLQSLQPPGERPAYQPESPESGRKLLESKGCTKCHRGSLALDFHHTRYGLTDFAAAMWNHPFRTGHHQTPLSVDEMRRLLGYFVATQFSDERGNPETGERLFAAKRCSLCHDNPASGAPSRAAMAGRMTSFGMVEALWKHGPAMLASMQRSQIPWPRFRSAEMADLSAYLYGRQLRRRPAQ